MRRFNHTNLVYGQTGQVVSFYPPDAEVLVDGAPTAAATCSVWKGIQSNDDTPILTPTCSLDPVSTTVSTASGYSQTNRRTLNVTSASNMAVGERYLLSTTASSPQREIAVLAQVGTAAVTEEDMSFDFASTATVKGLRHYFTIDSTFITTQNNINVWGAQNIGLLDPAYAERGFPTTAAPSFRVKWTYTTGSTQRVSWTTFDVVRKPAKANLSVVDLRSVVADLVYYEPNTQRGQDWQPQLIRAEADVDLDLRADGYEASSIADPAFYDRVVLWKWVSNCGLSLWVSSGTKPDWFDRVADEYNKLRAKFTGAVLRAKVDLGNTGATTVNPVQQMWFR